MRDGTATRKKLERCALNLFVEKGVIATTIKDIAGAAEVAEGTMYRHYQSKEDLATELYIRAYKELFHHLKAALDESKTIKEKIYTISTLVCSSYDQDPITFNYLLIAQHHQLPKINNQEFSLNRWACEVFAQAIKDGEVEQDDPNFYAGVLIGILLQAAAQRTYHRIEHPLADDAQKLAQTIIKALSL